MRVEIRQLLVDAIPEISGRVYEPSVAGPNLEKPYLVLREGVQDVGNTYANFTTIVEVWPYVSRTTFKNVDSLAQQVIDTLHRKRFDDAAGEPFLMEYLGTAGQDFVDEDWDAITRGLRFEVLSLAWLDGLTVEPDPVQAMQQWTEEAFSELQTDPASWAPTDVQPALYWRLVTITGFEPMAWGSWLTARLNGHIMAPGVRVRNEWMKKITQQLALDKRANLVDGSPMMFQTVSADSAADPFRNGQIQLTVRFGVLGPVPEIDKLNIAHVNTTDGAGGVAQ